MTDSDATEPDARDDEPIATEPHPRDDEPIATEPHPRDDEPIIVEPAARLGGLWSAGGDQRTAAIIGGVLALCLAVVILSESWTLFALALIAGGVWLLSQQSVGARPAAGSTPAASHQPVAQPPRAAAQPPPAPQWGEPPKREPRGPQRITRLVLSVLALLIAFSIAAATGNWFDVSATQMVGLGVVVIGIGVVVSALTDLGGRWLIPLGVFGLVLLLPVSAVDSVIDDGIGEPTYRPATVDDLADTYRHGVGVLTVDLRNLDFAGSDRSLDVELGVGEVIVIVPRSLGGTGSLQAGLGSVELELPNQFQVRDGIDVEFDEVRLAGSDGTLDLNVEVGLGLARLVVG